MNIVFKDVNECDEDTDSCHENATCANTDGFYNCTCKIGYGGDGEHCQGKCLTRDILEYLKSCTAFKL